MNIEDMSNQEIIQVLASRYESLVCSGSERGNGGGVKVGTFLKGRDHLPFVLQDIEVKAKDFLEGPKGPSRGPGIRVIK